MKRKNKKRRCLSLKAIYKTKYEYDERYECLMIFAVRIHPDVVIVLVFVSNVIVNKGVVCDVEPTGTAFAKLLEYCLDGPDDDP